jgi:hypothetical protein
MRYKLNFEPAEGLRHSEIRRRTFIGNTPKDVHREYAEGRSAEIYRRTFSGNTPKDVQRKYAEGRSAEIRRRRWLMSAQGSKRSENPG